MTAEEFLRSLSDETLAHVEFYINNAMVERVLTVHVADASGHCAGCTWHEEARPVWPCPLAYYAGVARELEVLFARHPRTPQGAGA